MFFELSGPDANPAGQITGSTTLDGLFTFMLFQFLTPISHCMAQAGMGYRAIGCWRNRTVPVPSKDFTHYFPDVKLNTFPLNSKNADGQQNARPPLTR